MKRRVGRRRGRGRASVVGAWERGCWLCGMHLQHAIADDHRAYLWASEAMFGDVFEHDAFAKRIRELPRGQSDRIALYMALIAESN